MPNGYDALQLGFEEIKEKKQHPSLIGHFKKNGSPIYRYVREFVPALDRRPRDRSGR
jgi:hypothetical protein